MNKEEITTELTKLLNIPHLDMLRMKIIELRDKIKEETANE